MRDLAARIADHDRDLAPSLAAAEADRQRFAVPPPLDAPPRWQRWMTYAGLWSPGATHTAWWLWEAEHGPMFGATRLAGRSLLFAAYALTAVLVVQPGSRGWLVAYVLVQLVAATIGRLLLHGLEERLRRTARRRIDAAARRPAWVAPLPLLAAVPAWAAVLALLALISRQ